MINIGLHKHSAFTNIQTNLPESEQHQNRRGRVSITVVECYHCSPSQTLHLWHSLPVTPSQSIAASTHITVGGARHRSSGYSSTVILQLFCKMGCNLPSTNHIYFMMSWNMLVEVSHSKQDLDFGQFRRRVIWKLAPVSHSHPGLNK